MQVGLEKVIAVLSAGLLVGPVVAQDLAKRPGAADPGPRPVGNQRVIRSFDGLSESQKQDMLNFLRSL